METTKVSNSSSNRNRFEIAEIDMFERRVGECLVERSMSWKIEEASNAPGTELLRVKSTLAEPDAALE